MVKNKENFHSLWEEKRKKKWQYIFLHGPVYLGIPMGVLIILIRSNFSIKDIHFPDSGYEVLFSVFISFVIVLKEFKRRDKIYLEMDKDESKRAD